MFDSNLTVVIQGNRFILVNFGIFSITFWGSVRLWHLRSTCAVVDNASLKFELLNEVEALVFEP